MPAASKHTAFALASIASVVALALLAGSAGGAWSNGKRDREAPSAPTNLRVTAATPSSVSLAWDAATDNVGVAGYYVYVNSMRARVEGTTYTAENLECGSSVAVQVVAFDYTRNRSPQAEATVSTAACPDLQPPTPPDGFRQEATTQTSVVLAWNASSDNVGVVSYGIFRDGLAVDSAPAPSVALTGLTCGRTYRYDVDAADAAGNRSQRSAAWVTTADCSDGQPPTAPTNLAVTGRTVSSLTLSWSPSTDNIAVSGYRVMVDNVPTADVAETTATLSGLTCGMVYRLSVDAYDAAGNRSPAAKVTGETDACPPPPAPPSPPGTLPPTADTTPPTQPTGVGVAAATRTSVSLTWAASTDNVGVTGYGIYVNGTRVQTTSELAATVSGLTCGTAYSFAVDAADAAGNRSTRASVTATTSACADTQPPTAPANVTATSRTATSIALSWSASSDNVGVAGYGLYRGSTPVGTSSGTTGIFSGLTCNTNYTLAVDAFDAAANRSAKTTVMVSTTACADTTPPSTPGGLAASNVSQTSLTLTWNASSDNVGVVAYDVYRNGTLMSSVTSTSSAQAGLACGTSYWFAVEARDAAGNRSAKAQVNPTTAACSAPQPPPPPPSGSSIDHLSDLRTPWNCWGDANRNVTMNRFRPTADCNIWAPADQGAMPATPQAWADGGGIFEADTAHGPGFKVAVTAEMTAPWGGKQAWLADVDHLTPYASFLGTTEDWSGRFMFPASGNPNGFPNHWHAGVLWEFHTETMSGHHFAVDGAAAGGPRIRFGVHDAAADNYRFSWSAATIAFDHWYSWRLRIKWSTGSDGFVQGWLDGVQLADYQGPTIKAGEHPKLQFGYYANPQLRNEVWFASLRKS